MAYEIVCARGPMKGRRWLLTPQGLKIGRADRCEIHVGDVSAELYHCVVKLVGEKPVVSNLASDNGVDVNGTYVDEAELCQNDIIRIGGESFIILSPANRKARVVRGAIAVIFVSIAVIGAVVCRQMLGGAAKPTPSEAPASTISEAAKARTFDDAVSTNRVGRPVSEKVVSTSNIVRVVDNVVITNYIVEVRRDAELMPENLLSGKKENMKLGSRSPNDALADKYCVIDLSAGPGARLYKVTYLDRPPVGGFNKDEYKTRKLVLRRIEPGSYLMCGRCSVTLSNSFYCGMFEVTQRQYEIVAGRNPSRHGGQMRPVECVSYNMLRGSILGARWPLSSEVDGNSFIGKLRARTGMNFDLPTEAQWEYACRAGTKGKYNDGSSTEAGLGRLCRYWGNRSDGDGGYLVYHTTVGSYAPNAWDIYDMHGNVSELCLDKQGPPMPGTDPKGAEYGDGRIWRGGNWETMAEGCTSSARGTIPETGYGPCTGFRVVMNLSDSGGWHLDIAQRDCPYEIINSAKALAMGGASGGDEVRMIANTNGTHDIIHIYTETGNAKTLVVPDRNSIVSGSSRFLLVGGGGACRSSWGGGGGGGVVVRESLNLNPGTAYVYVGSGGATGWYDPVSREKRNRGYTDSSGEDSVLTICGKTYVAIGGGAGGGFSGGSPGGGLTGGVDQGGKMKRELQSKLPGGGYGGERNGGCSMCGAGPAVASSISGRMVTYACGGECRSPSCRNASTMAIEAHTGAGMSRGGGPSQESMDGVVVVRYTVRKPIDGAVTGVVSANLPKPDKNVMSRRIGGIEWRYFLEGDGSVTIGSHAEESVDFPDLWTPAVDKNAIGGVVEIPSRIGYYPVRKIGRGAFQGCTQVTKFIVPEGVTHCGARAFARCAQLQEVVYPKSLQWLGEGQVFRSPRVATLEFQSLPPRSNTACCPFKGADSNIVLAFPFSVADEWRNFSTFPSKSKKEAHLCDDGCHYFKCRVKFSPYEVEQARRTYAGFIGEEIYAPPIEDITERKRWMISGMCEVWRKYDTLVKERKLSLSYVPYATMNVNKATVYVTMMYFRADEPVSFGANLPHDKSSMVIVDNVAVMEYLSKDAYKNCPVKFDKSDWHRVALIVMDTSKTATRITYSYDGVRGLYFRRGDGPLECFEAKPDGSEFRITPADARRAVAEIEKARRKKQK